MIEAIAASVSNAQIVRQVTDEASASQAANPVRIQKAAVTAPYLSPHVRLAPDTKPIFVVRDLNTGEQVKQFPTEAQIRAYQRASQSKADTVALSTNGEPQNISREEAKLIVETSVQFKAERKAVQADKQGFTPGQSGAGQQSEAPVSLSQKA